MADKILNSKKLVFNRKTFFLDLGENAGGRFLKIKERRNDHHTGGDLVVIPEDGFPQFAEAVQAILDEASR